MTRLAAAPIAALLLALPTAAAVDLLPSEVRFGELEARILVRSAPGGTIRVTTQPPVLAAGVAPGAQGEPLVPTPAQIAATHVWRGIDGIVEIVLQRDDASIPVDIIVEDDASAGVWLEWLAEDDRRLPAAIVLGVLAALTLVSGYFAFRPLFGR